MKTNLILAGRLTLGLALVVFGLNGFLQFIPVPPPAPAAGALLGAFFKTGYFFPFIKIAEIFAGSLLLSNRLVPFALAFIFPIIIGFTQIHLFLDPAGLALPLILLAIHAFLTHGHWAYFKTVMTIKTES